MKTKNALFALCALTLAAGLAAPAARAQEHPNDVRLGLYYVHYAPNADDITGPGVPTGLNLGLEDTATLYAAYVRSITNHIAAELAFGWPPLTKTVAHGPATVGSVPYDGQVIATARWLSPTFLVEYVFLDPESTLRPYVGLGVNYTQFYDRQSTAAGNAVSGGPTSISLPASIGPAATVGVTYRLSERWALHASYSAAKVHTTLTADTAGVIRTTHIDFWPLALVLSAGFSF